MNRKWQATKRNSAKCGKVWFTNVRHFILCFYFTCLSSCVVLCTLFIMPSSHSFFPAHLKRRFIYGCPLSTSFHHFSAVDICLFSTVRVCTTLVTRNVANRQRFSSRSSYLKLQIRSVYFVTQQFSSLKRKRRRNTETKRIKKNTSPTSSSSLEVAYSISCVVGDESRRRKNVLKNIGLKINQHV